MSSNDDDDEVDKTLEEDGGDEEFHPPSLSAKSTESTAGADSGSDKSDTDGETDNNDDEEDEGEMATKSRAKGKAEKVAVNTEHNLSLAKIAKLAKVKPFRVNMLRRNGLLPKGSFKADGRAIMYNERALNAVIKNSQDVRPGRKSSGEASARAPRAAAAEAATKKQRGRPRKAESVDPTSVLVKSNGNIVGSDIDASVFTQAIAAVEKKAEAVALHYAQLIEALRQGEAALTSLTAVAAETE